MFSSPRIPILLLIGWLIFGSWFWTYRVRGFGEGGMSEAEPKSGDAVPALVEDAYSLRRLAKDLRFTAGSSQAEMPTSQGWQDLVQTLQEEEGTQLQIIGLYHRNESHPEDGNLGLARANFLATQLTKQGIAEDRLTRLPQQVPTLLQQDTLPRGIRLSYLTEQAVDLPSPAQDPAVTSQLVPAFTHAFYFDYRPSGLTLSSQEQRLITQVMQFVRSNRSATVHLIGHTDDTDAAAYNYRLGLHHAQAVREYLIAFGLAASRIQVHSQGETQPLASNATPAGRQKNRRVELNVSAQP